MEHLSLVLSPSIHQLPFVDRSVDRDRMEMDHKWLSLATASKEELQIVADMLIGVIRCVPLHPHPLCSPDIPGSPSGLLWLTMILWGCSDT